jgi:hypothetical protein
LPSIGSPSALTTRPSSASPTGTVWIRPVALTDLLLLEVVDLAEDDGTDGVLVEVQGQAEGPVLELEQLVHRRTGQPDTRAMPSPTSTMRPTCSVPRPGCSPGVYSASRASAAPSAGPR